MQNITVSIIIPVYKVEPYIERCIDSVLRQTYRNLEVILVDDCSPDRSMDIVHEHIEASELSKGQQFIYLKHDHNRGLSAARNTGINAATGEYIYFLDSDDWIIPKCVELMVGCVKMHPDVEMVYAGAKATRGLEWLSFEKKNLPEYSDNRDWINQTLLKRSVLNMTAWNKLARRSFIIENNLFFEEGYIHEDEIWNFEMAKYVSKIAICKHDTYIYDVREGSIMANQSKLEHNRLTLLKYFVSHVTRSFRKRQISFIFQFIQDDFGSSIPPKYASEFLFIHNKLIREACGKQKLALWMYYRTPKMFLNNYHVYGRVINAIGRV